MSQLPETNLSQLLKNMSPRLQEGSYVFTTLSTLESIPPDLVVGTFRENEGFTVILQQEDADELNLAYHFVAAWITLEVHSALEAVGLTAAFSSELAKNDISCNVIAGYHHDHLFVPKKDEKRALEALWRMTSSSAQIVVDNNSFLLNQPLCLQRFF